MRPLFEMSAQICRRIDTIFTDIDDTLTVDGLIPDAAYTAIWRAVGAKLRVVLVTGRPAGWCDHLARMWPVDAVVGENGALCFALHKGKMRRIYAARDADAAEKLEQIKKEVLHTVAGCKVAADQPYREYDLAIDFCEEVDPLDAGAVERIRAVFEKHGATAKISSIHVNGWFGCFDKLSMCRRLSEELWGCKLAVERATFVGDSPNDAPMFAAFPHSCGVANIASFADRMETLPAYVTVGCGGVGFAELVNHILVQRAA